MLRRARTASTGQRVATRAALGSLIAALFVLFGFARQGLAQVLSDVGYVGPTHGGLSAPTGEKPESKLWFAGGYWWADLYNPEVRQHHIYRFDPETHEWYDTGTALDTRPSSRSDVLWDAETQRLYVVSHVFSTSAAPTSAASNWGYLYRFSYDRGLLRYLPDDGFPVPVTRGKSETLTLAKDSIGRLWVTYVESRQVMVNHSEDGDMRWGEPHPLRTQNSGALSDDDIAAVISFGGDRIGVAWSNQRRSTMYFAVHLDSALPGEWAEETIIAERNMADDHINLKADRAGRVYLASKTSDEGEAPLVVLYVRDLAGVWTVHPFGTGADHHTRPIVLLDEERQRLHMFAASPESGGLIYYKQTALEAIQFPSGPGRVILQNAVDYRINNVTSTKQSVDQASGILILASGSTNRYFFNYITLDESSSLFTPMPEIATAIPLTPDQATPARATPIQSPPAGQAPGLAPSLP